MIYPSVLQTVCLSFYYYSPHTSSHYLTRTVGLFRHFNSTLTHSLFRVCLSHTLLCLLLHLLKHCSAILTHAVSSAGIFNTSREGCMEATLHLRPIVISFSRSCSPSHLLPQYTFPPPLPPCSLSLCCLHLQYSRMLLSCEMRIHLLSVLKSTKANVSKTVSLSLSLCLCKVPVVDIRVCLHTDDSYKLVKLAYNNTLSLEHSTVV